MASCRHNYVSCRMATIRCMLVRVAYEVTFRSVDKEDLKDTITGVKRSALAWMKDKSGIFYSKFPDHK
ncbi:hypothetical protein COOONC_10420, partial [Cooperia oncophora]